MKSIQIKSDKVFEFMRECLKEKDFEPHTKEYNEFKEKIIKLYKSFTEEDRTEYLTVVIPWLEPGKYPNEFDVENKIMMFVPSDQQNQDKPFNAGLDS